MRPLLRLPLRLAKAVPFSVLFLWELVLANTVVAWEVLTPRNYMRPGIVAVPIRARHDHEIAMLANLISLTPGTLTLEVAEDRSVLYVHSLHLLSPDHLRSRVSRLEDRLLWMLR
jgi:multicomponent Na+:H+ antiporter subunit E